MDQLQKPIGTPSHKTLGGWAATQLRDMIISGRLEPGQRLYEQELAARMDISRTPIREAIRQLEREGLLTVRPNRETVVTTLTPSDIREVYVMRAALEGMAARLAAMARGGEEAGELLEILAKAEVAVASDDSEAFLQLDLDLHEAILRASRNGRLMEAALRVRSQTRRYLALSLRLRNTSPQGLRPALEEHTQLTQAILAGDADLAERLMRVYIEKGGESVAATIDAIPVAPLAKRA
jgi:DNA-binding GntR family transcriptional regulator